MRLFRRKKKETPRKSKPASIYYSPAAASTPTALRSEEVAVPQTPQERALADFAAQTPTLRTPVQIPSSRNGDLDGADLRDTLARADIDPEAKRRLEALLDRLEAAERAAVQTPVRRQVSWDPATVERPPVVKDESWRSLQRAPSTPTTPSKHLLLAFGLDDAANSPTAKRRRRGYLVAAGAVAVACVFAGAAPALSRESRRRAALRRPPEPVAPCVEMKFWAPRSGYLMVDFHAGRAPGQGHRRLNPGGVPDEETAARARRLCGAAHGRAAAKAHRQARRLGGDGLLAAAVPADVRLTAPAASRRHFIPRTYTPPPRTRTDDRRARVRCRRGTN
jgi:hypothetical protein